MKRIAMSRIAIVLIFLLTVLLAVRRPLLAQMNPDTPNDGAGENADQGGNGDQTTQPDDESGGQQADPDDPGNNGGDATDPDQDQNNNDTNQANADADDAQQDDGDAGQ